MFASQEEPPSGDRFADAGLPDLVGPPRGTLGYGRSYMNSCSTGSRSGPSLTGLAQQARLVWVLGFARL